MLTSVYTRARLGTGPDISDSLAEMVGRRYCSSDHSKCGLDGRRGGKVGRGKGEFSQKGQGVGGGGVVEDRGESTRGAVGYLTNK